MVKRKQGFKVVTSHQPLQNLACRRLIQSFPHPSKIVIKVGIALFHIPIPIPTGLCRARDRGITDLVVRPTILHQSHYVCKAVRQ